MSPRRGPSTGSDHCSLNRWSTRVPVELSNRGLRSEGWEHDGVCLKVAVAEARVSATGPPEPSRVDRVMQLQQSHPPILVGVGSRWMLGIAGREADIVCNLPRAPPEGRSPRSTKAITPAHGPQGRVGRTGGRAPGRDGDMVLAAGPHRLTCANRTGKSLANGSCRPPSLDEAACQTPPNLMFCVEPPAGIEPATPTLPWNHQEPLCEPPFSKVAPDRRGRSYRFSFDAVMRSLSSRVLVVRPTSQALVETPVHHRLDAA